jgi:hypothetical protein
MANGCDYSKTLFLRSRDDAFEAMAKYVRLLDGIPAEQLRLVDVVIEVAGHESR